jgi:hypothetical protein
MNINISELLKKPIRDWSFEEKIEYVRVMRLSLPRKVRIALDVAKEDYQLQITGNYIRAVEATNTGSNIEIKFNNIDGDKLKFTKGFCVKTPFTEIYITHEAQAGEYIELTVASLGDDLFNIEDDRSEGFQVSILENIRDDQRATIGSDNAEETVGNAAEVGLLAANLSRKNFSVQAKDTNRGVIYILYKTGVASDKYKVILQAGQVLSDDKWRGAVVAIASAAGQLCCAQEET